MAKLNGVEIIEMKDGAVTKIKYDGEVYEYAEGFDRREGNIVQNLTVTLDAEIGAFYETDLRGTAIDDEGDQHYEINKFGRTFVKAQETAGAKEGDLIRIVDKFSEGQPYDNGDVFTVSRTYGDGDIRVNNNRHFVLEQEYSVIEPKEDTPQVGDKIRVYDSFISDDQYADGDVLKVTEVSETGSVHAEGVDVRLFRREFEIVPTDTPVTKSSTCVKDVLNGRVDELEERVGKLEKDGKTSQNIEAGDKVRLDIPKGEKPRFGWGRVKNGEEGEVTKVISDDKVRVHFPSQNFWNADISELVVVEEGKTPKAIEKGDTVRLVSKEDSFRTLNGFSVGELCEVLSLRYCVEDKVELMSEGGTWGVARLSNLVAVSKDGETEQERKTVEGDIVVITGNTNDSTNEVGDIGIVTDILSPIGSPCVKVHGRKHGRGINHTKYSDMRLATAEERAEYYRKEKAENLEKLDVSARDLSFIRAGREPGEHKKGGIVRVEDACGSPLIEGNFYELSYSGSMATISQGSSRWRAIVTLVTPVESRTDIEHGDE